MTSDHLVSSSSSAMVLVERWFLCHQPWLLDRLRLRLPNDRTQAEDLTAETFACVVQQAHSGSALAEVREPRAFLTTIAKRQLFQFWRRRDLERAWLDHLEAQSEPLAASPEERFEALQALEQIAMALDGLAPKAQRAFLLSQLDGLTYREIGEQLGVSASMVRQYMAQAHRRLAGLE